MHLIRTLSNAFVAMTLAAFAAGDVLVVDAAGGGDYTQIQQAVLAAGEGTVILVESGDYAAVRVVGKGLAILADEGADVRVLGGVVVEQTLAEQRVILAGLKIIGLHNNAGATPEALTLHLARGPVRVEDCTLDGADGLIPHVIPWGADACTAFAALDLSFVGCTLRGGRGIETFTIGGDENRGGTALATQLSKVALHECELRGGDGGTGCSGCCYSGGLGGHGAHLEDSTLLAQASAFFGGDGGWGDLCGDSEDGGHGLWLDGTTDGHLLEVLTEGGEGGACGFNCGDDGQDLAVGPGASVQLIAGSARTLVAPTPVREGTIVTFTFEGEPGDGAFVLFSTGPAYALMPSLKGVLLLELPLAQGRRFMGPIPGGGTLVKPVPIPMLGGGSEDATLFLQAMFQDPSGGVWLASPTSLVILDASF